MTEQTSQFGGTTLAEPPAPVLPVGNDDSSDDANRRKLAVVGAVAGVLVLLIAAFFLLKGHGSSSDNATGAVVHHTVPAGSSGSTAGHHPITLPKTFKGAIGRDPFKPLYTPPAPKTAGTGTTSTGSTSTGTTGTGTSTGTGTGTSTGTTPPASYAPVWVELVSVKGTKSATFIVGYSNGKHSKQTQYADVAAPTHSLRTTFASVFALLSVQDGTATVQFGDGTPFDLAPGFGNRHFVG
jgi:hypothetical protein